MSKAYYRSLISSNNTKIRNYNSRISKVKKIKDNIRTKFDTEITDINVYLVDCMQSLEGGIDGVTKVGTVYDNLGYLKESYDVVDGNLVSCTENLNSEITRCNDKISRLEAQNATYESKIREIERREAEERRKQLEAMMDAARDALKFW